MSAADRRADLDLLMERWAMMEDRSDAMRLVLADAMCEAGRGEEADLLRDLSRPAMVALAGREYPVSRCKVVPAEVDVHWWEGPGGGDLFAFAAGAGGRPRRGVLCVREGRAVVRLPGGAALAAGDVAALGGSLFHHAPELVAAARAAGFVIGDQAAPPPPARAREASHES